MFDQHALLGASSAHRWLVCTPSARLEAACCENETPSVYAREGTLAHSCAELVVRYLILGKVEKSNYAFELEQLKRDELWQDEILDHAKAYAAFVDEALTRIKETCPDPQIELELRLNYSAYAPEGFGTGDCIIVGDGTLAIIDYKYGKGHKVEADHNPQMMLYALGAYEQYKLLYNIETVEMSIFQPRIAGGSTCTLPMAEVITWGLYYVSPRAVQAYRGEGDYAPGDEPCRFCKCGGFCTARAERNLALFNEHSRMDTMTTSEIGLLLKRCADIPAWIDAMEQRVKGALLDGERVNGWKLVEGRSNRKFADEDSVVARLKAAGYPEPILYERKLRTLTQIEKDIGKKVFAETLKDLIVKPQGQPTLAPDTDKRDEWRPTDDLLNAFDD